MNKILILVGSMRKGGNTDLEDAGMVLVRGAKDKGDVSDDALDEAYRLGL